MNNIELNCFTQFRNIKEQSQRIRLLYYQKLFQNLNREKFGKMSNASFSDENSFLSQSTSPGK